MMGHAKVDTTVNVYTHVIDGALRAAVDKVGSELFTIVHKPEMGGALERFRLLCSAVSAMPDVIGAFVRREEAQCRGNQLADLLKRARPYGA